VWLPCRLLSFKAGGVVAAITERFVLRLAAATEIDRGKLVFLIFFALMVEQLGSAFHLIGTVFRYTNYYIRHNFLLLHKMIDPSIPLPSMTQRGKGFNHRLPDDFRL
jgi:hypothetical protein